MIGQIKFRLLCWLLGDICMKSSCIDCEVDKGGDVDVMCPCGEKYIYTQARKVWGLE